MKRWKKMAETIVLTKDFIEGLGLTKQDSISLSKNSKGYTWDIKIYSKDLMTESDAIQAKIGVIDAALNSKYGAMQ